MHFISFYDLLCTCGFLSRASNGCTGTFGHFEQIQSDRHSSVSVVMQSRILTTFSNTVMCNAAVADAVWLH